MSQHHRWLHLFQQHAFKLMFLPWLVCLLIVLALIGLNLLYTFFSLSMHQFNVILNYGIVINLGSYLLSVCIALIAMCVDQTTLTSTSAPTLSTFLLKLFYKCLLCVSYLILLGGLLLINGF